VAALAACGASNDAAQPSRTVPPGTVPTTLPIPTTLPVEYTCTPDPDPLTVEAGKPTVEVPEGDPPTELVTTDLTVGDGPVAEVGDKVQMQYVGVLYSDGSQFDASWDNGGTPFEVELGPNAMVIEGWNQGIPGMQLGGRRQLVIPPDLAYADRADNPDIPPNSTLVFVVDLVQVCKPIPVESTTTTLPIDPTGSSVPESVPGSTPATDPTGSSIPG
jgi:peptidylprolyl isomerase